MGEAEAPGTDALKPLRRYQTDTWPLLTGFKNDQAKKPSRGRCEWRTFPRHRPSRGLNAGRGHGGVSSPGGSSLTLSLRTPTGRVPGRFRPRLQEGNENAGCSDHTRVRDNRFPACFPYTCNISPTRPKEGMVSLTHRPKNPRAQTHDGFERGQGCGGCVCVCGGGI